MKKVLLLFFGILGTAFAQTTVFSDNFNTSQGSTYSTSGNIGTTNWAINRWGADFGARIDGNILEMTNDASTTTNVAGWVYVNQPFSIISTPFNSTLGSNTGLVTWTFNMRQIRADPAGFTTGSYGVAYILGSSGQTTQTGGTGYAVVLGQSGSTDPIRLVRFSAGLQTITNIITSNTSGLTDFGAEYLSVKVTYNPTTNTWALFLRSDGTSAFADPTTGTLVSQGTIVDNTYTGTSLNYFGFYWQGSTAANQTAFFDNLKIIVDAPAPPSAPTASNASDILQTSFTANWNFVSGAATYLLDVSKVNDFSTFVSGYNGKDVGNVASSNVIGLGADSTYYYRVRASNTNGTSPNSNTITINTLPNPPAAPTANEATNVTQTGMTANWGSINGATKYFLDVSIASDFSTFVTNLDNKDLGSVTSYALASLASGTTYYYRVRAYNSGGTSSNSNTMSKTLIPANPISAASTSITQTGFNANWSAVTGAALYFIDVSTEKDFSTYVTGYQNKNTGTNTISVTGLTASIKYFFRLRAQNTSGTSGNSIIDSVTTLPNPPGAPVASAGTAISSSSFTANWSDVPEATTNFITVSEDSNFASNTISNLEVGDVTSYTVSGLTPATDYYYVIKAGNAGGTSANSNVISVSTNPGVPGAPVATEAAALSNTGFTANWNAVGGVTKYFLDVSKVNDFSTFVDGFNAKDVGNITTFAVSGLSASTEYHYRVRASNVTGVSDNSNVIAVTTNPPAPNAPAAIAAAAITSSGFTAKWNISANAAKYFLDVSAQIDFSTTITGYNYVDVGNVTSVNVAGLTAGTDYYYRVYATNVTGTSAASNTITTITVPSAPAASTATNIAQTGFTANWNTVTGAAKYYLDVSTQNNFSTFILGYDSTDIGNVLTTNVTGLAANTDYHYRVRAGNASGLSVNSNVVSVTTLPNAPEAP
ncbi:MAG: fibronectin type III domain-containing protein, partial [Bacteroidota bacterium]